MRSSDRTLERLMCNLRLPAIAAPMFLVSGPAMVVAACKAGIIGAFPTPNCRTSAALEDWLTEIEAGLAACPEAACYAANLVVHRSNPRLADDLAAVVRHRTPLVITALGSPRTVVDTVHGYGGLVFADVNSVGFARKAVASGVDGLVLVASGAGGHTGQISAFAFVEEVRRFWSGPIVLGGAISTGRGIRAAELLGADFAYLGTALLPCAESMAAPAYKQLVVDAGAEDIVASNGITGVTANWLRASLLKAGFDPDNMPRDKQPDFANAHSDVKAWKDVWSAGQGVGAVTEIAPMAEIVDRLVAEYEASLRTRPFHSRRCANGA
ncbi:MAG: NAD(P)H-dependent flavin oxidoreductase [Hyphomonadaceae bacterium]